jgi:hypothetical protein
MLDVAVVVLSISIEHLYVAVREIHPSMKFIVASEG